MCAQERAGAFGATPARRWDDGDREGWEYENPFDALPDSLAPLLGPELQAEFAAWPQAVSLCAGALYGDLATAAECRILTAATNDALALVRHVDHFDGRSAAHAARALFEHLVNMLDVHTSPVNTAARYEDHEHVTADQVSRRRWHLRLLSKRARKRESDRLDKLQKRAAGPLARAVEAYGSSFKRGWAHGTLRARADAHDLGEGYGGYQILSGVIHGSSGALSGVVRQVRGENVHRVGYDLELAATAYAEGLVSFYNLAEHLVTLTGRVEAEEIRGRTGNLLLGLDEVRDTLRKADAKLWPTTPVPGPMAVVALYPSGARRWYLHDPRDESIVVAEPPEDEPDLSVAEEKLATYDPDRKSVV